ncbi:MAG: GatB/YqeY domain-containing protein [Saprospiraceae bacterium]|nr:GatB/YqeY domain-containing protein [Saprospiraceae bacterium]
MSLESRIMEDLKTAMKAKDQAAMRAIRAIKSAILLKQTDGTGGEINADEEIKILQKLVKSRKESLDIYKKQNRQDLAKIEEDEISIIEHYLPAAMSEDEARALVAQIISQTGASSMKDMGSVMAQATAQAAGRVDGKLLAQLVRQKLS